MTTTEKIKKYEEAVAKAKSGLAKSEAMLSAEKKKLRDEQMKELNNICKKGNMNIEDIIRLAKAISDNNVTVDEVFLLIEPKK